MTNILFVILNRYFTISNIQNIYGCAIGSITVRPPLSNIKVFAFEGFAFIVIILRDTLTIKITWQTDAPRICDLKGEPAHLSCRPNMNLTNRKICVERNALATWISTYERDGFSAAATNEFHFIYSKHHSTFCCGTVNQLLASGDRCLRIVKYANWIILFLLLATVFGLLTLSLGANFRNVLPLYKG